VFDVALSFPHPTDDELKKLIDANL